MRTEDTAQGRDPLIKLQPHISSTRELPGGYAFLIAGHASPVLALVELLTLEELSCPSGYCQLGASPGRLAR